MRKGFWRRSFETLLVFTVLLTAIVLLEIFKDATLRLWVITSLTSFYVIIGIVYHYEAHNLKPTQILEHLAIGAMMFVVLSAVYH